MDYRHQGWIDSYIVEFSTYSSAFAKMNRHELRKTLCHFAERYPGIFRETTAKQQAPVVQLMSFMGKVVDDLINVEASVDEASWMESFSAKKIEQLSRQLQDVE